MPRLFQRLAEGVAIEELEKDHPHGYGEFRYGDDSPTGEPIVYINSSRFPDQKNWQNFIKLELLHGMKYKEPELHQDIYNTALADPEYMKFARTSYDILTGKIPNPETGKYVPEDKREKRRNFEDWHKYSRFDQLMGGYAAAGDPGLYHEHWDRDKLPMGPELRQKLEWLRSEYEYQPSLGQKPDSNVGQRPVPK